MKSKNFVLMVVTSLFAGSFAQANPFEILYDCKGQDVRVVLTKDAKTLVVTRGQGIFADDVVSTSSQTGEDDQTFITKSGVKLVIDNRYGDSVTIAGETLPLTCVSH